MLDAHHYFGFINHPLGSESMNIDEIDDCKWLADLWCGIDWGADEDFNSVSAVTRRRGRDGCVLDAL